MKRRLLPLLLAVVLVVAAMVPVFALTAAAETVTVSRSHTQLAETISSATDGTSINGKDIAFDENITVRFDKGTSTSNPVYKTDEIRMYQNGATLTVTANEGVTMETIVITLSSTSGGQGPISVTGGVAGSLTNKQYTITVNNGVSEVVVKTTGTSKTTRVYVANIAITYDVASSGGTEDPDTPPCQHTNTTTKTVDATCTEDGSTTVTCNDCGETVSEETISATGHSYGDDNICDNDNCGYEKPQIAGTYVIATLRSGSYWYMTSDLGTANTKRYQAIDSGLTKLPENISNPADNCVFVIEDAGNETYYIYAANVESKNYLGWTSDNSGILVAKADAKALTIKENNDGTVTIGFDSRMLALNSTSGNNYFAWYGGTQSKYLVLIPVVEAECKHTNTTETTTPATCTEPGSKTVTCNDCDAGVILSEEIPATGHTLVNAECKDCDYVAPANTYYIAAFRGGSYWYMTSDLGTASTKRYQAINSALTELPVNMTAGVNEAGVFVIERNEDGTYSIYATNIDGDEKYIGWTSGNSGTLVAKENAAKLTITVVDGAYNITVVDNDEGNESGIRYLSLNNTNNNYFAFYAGTQIHNLALIPVNADVLNPEPEVTEPKFDAVSMLVSNDLALNYLVKVPTGFAGELTVKFTVDGKEIWGELQTELNNGRYVFSLYGIAPQDIAKNIKAELFVDGVKLEGADKDYSVLTYINNTIDKYADNTELVALLKSVLVYGQVAKDYIGADGDAIADAGLVDEALNAATKPDADFDRDANKPEGEKPYANYFTGASVRFDYVNKLCLKIYAEADEFTVYVDGVAVEATLVSGNNYVVWVDVMIKDFDRTYNLEIKVDGEATHTMSYSVNNYLAAMWDDADLKDLEKATYLLGVAAYEYAAVEDQLN